MHKLYLDTEVKLKLTESLILSRIAYCNVVYWPALSQTNKNSLQKIQNYCLRFAYNLRKYDHVSDKFRESHWLTLDERFQVQMACLVLKLDSFGIPEYLCKKLVKNVDIHM